jgi:hypothetical protein
MHSANVVTYNDDLVVLSEDPRHLLKKLPVFRHSCTRVTHNVQKHSEPKQRKEYTLLSFDNDTGSWWRVETEMLTNHRVEQNSSEEATAVRTMVLGFGRQALPHYLIRFCSCRGCWQLLLGGQRWTRPPFYIHTGWKHHHKSHQMKTRKLERERTSLQEFWIAVELANTNLSFSESKWTGKWWIEHAFPFSS